MIAAHFPALRTAGPNLAAIVIGVTATLVLVTLPIFVAGIAGQFGWNEQAIGWLAAADMGGSALASLVLALAVSRLPWKKSVWLAILAVVAGNLASIFLDTLPAMLAVRALTGFCNGLILSVVFVALCQSSNPDRYFGIYVFLQLLLQVILLPVLPRMIEPWGIASVFLLFALASACTAALVFFFPQPGAMAQTRTTKPQPGAGGVRARLSAWAVVALAAQAVYFLAPSAIWAYFEGIGKSFELAIEAVGDALGLASFAGIAGALLVVVMGSRVNRIVCMAAGTLISIAAIGVLLQASGFAWFLLAAALVNFSWNYTFPYQMGALALFDRDGSVAILSLVVQLSGLSFGPVLASVLLTGADYSAVLWVCMACYILSFALFLLSSRRAIHLAEPFP